MKWLLVVFVTSSIGDPAPTAIFQTAVYSETLCRSAAADLTAAIAADETGLVKVSVICLLVSTKSD